MATPQLKELKELRAQVRKIKDTLDYYQTLFEADGEIDDYEQGQLDKLNSIIKTIEAAIDEKEEKLKGWDKTKNFVAEKTEGLKDLMSKKDDDPDHALIDERPTKEEDTNPTEDTPTENPPTNDTNPVEDNPSEDPSNDVEDKPEEPVEVEVHPIKASVGADTAKSKAKNDPEDVKIVQTLLVDQGYNLGTTGPNGDGVDGVCTPKTIDAIKDFQGKNFTWTPDGNIGANGKTWAALALGKIIDTHEISDDGLGVGADDDDEYKSQRDNETLSLSHSKSKPVTGDSQCNVTSLAMMLISLNGGDEAGVIDIVQKAIKKGGATYESSWGLEELLAQYTEKIEKGSIFSSSRMGEIAADLLKDKVSSSEDIWVNESKPQDAIDKWKETIVPLLKKGCEVIISGRFTHGGHIVSLRSVKSSGVILQDPYGMCIVQGVYMRNGQIFSKDDLAKYQMEIKRRLSVNGRFDEIKDMIEAGKVLPQNLGSNNYYSWEDFGSMKIYRFVVAHKK